MPFLNLRTVKGMLTDDQKRLLMDEFTRLLVETEGGGNPEFRKLVWILIDEIEPEQWQVGELRPTAALISALAQQREAKQRSA